MALDGAVRVETRHTAYEFENGICCGVSARDGGPAKSGENVVGMRLVSWADERGRLVDGWKPGLRAVLWSAEGDARGGAIVALTSSTFAFMAIDDHAVPRDPLVAPARTRLHVVPPPPASMTRLVDTA